MTKIDTSGAVDFRPDSRGNKVTISITLDNNLKADLLKLQASSGINISRYINGVLSAVLKSKSLHPREFIFEQNKYREVKLLLRNEVADFIENALNYGGLVIREQEITGVTPLSLGKKISAVLAADYQFSTLDTNIYNEERAEKSIEYLGELAQGVPE